MHALAVLLICSASASHGHILQNMPGSLNGASQRTRTLSRLLQAFQSAAAFHASSGGLHPSLGNHLRRERSLPKAPVRAGQPRALTIPEGAELKMLSDMILVDIDTIPVETKAGVLLPTVYATNICEHGSEEVDVDRGMQKARVRSMGPGVKKIDGTHTRMPEIQIGQTVMIGPKCGQSVKSEDGTDNEDTLLLAVPDDIWAACESADEELSFNNYKLPGPMHAMGNKLLVKLRPREQKVSSGLLLGGSVLDQDPLEAIVVSAGPGRVDDTGEFVPNPCKVGDIIRLQDMFQGVKEVKYQGERYFFLDANAAVGYFVDGDVSSSSFRPLQDRVVVKLAEPPQITMSGLAVVEQENEDVDQGDLVLLGPEALELKEGQPVLFKRNKVEQIDVAGDMLTIGFASDVISTW